jgi:hypothetical protein
MVDELGVVARVDELGVAAMVDELGVAVMVDELRAGGEEVGRPALAAVAFTLRWRTLSVLRRYWTSVGEAEAKGEVRSSY